MSQEKAARMPYRDLLAAERRCVFIGTVLKDSQILFISGDGAKSKHLITIQGLSREQGSRYDIPAIHIRASCCLFIVRWGRLEPYRGLARYVHILGLKIEAPNA